MPLFFCAHLDTVPPEGPIEPVVEDGVVRNAAGTILGADNKAAVAAMLEAVRRVVQEGLPHAGIELLFTPKEEVGLVGAAAFDERGSPRASATSTTRPRRSARSILARRTQRSSTCASTAGPRTRGCTPRRAAPRSRPRRGRSPTSGSAGSTRRRRRTSGRSRAAPRRTSSRSGARSPPKRARTTSASSADVVAGDARALRRSPRASRSARSRPRLSESYRGYRFRRGRPGGPARRRRRSSARATSRASTSTGGGCGRERLQRARAAVRQPRQRDGGDPHAGRAHRGRRPRRHGRGHARAGRRRARC